MHNLQEGVIKAAKREKKTRNSRLQCGAVPFQRVPSQKSRGDPSRTPPSSHLVLARSLMIEILGVDLRSDLPGHSCKTGNVRYGGTSKTQN